MTLELLGDGGQIRNAAAAQNRMKLVEGDLMPTQKVEASDSVSRRAVLNHIDPSKLGFELGLAQSVQLCEDCRMIEENSIAILAFVGGRYAGRFRLVPVFE